MSVFRWDTWTQVLLHKSPWDWDMGHNVGCARRFLPGSCAHHVERHLGEVIVLASQDTAEAAQRLLQGHVLTGGSGEHLCNLWHNKRVRSRAISSVVQGFMLTGDSVVISRCSNAELALGTNRKGSLHGCAGLYIEEQPSKCDQVPT